MKLCREITINGYNVSTYLSDDKLKNAKTIAELIINEEYDKAKEIFNSSIQDLDAMQTIALRDAIKHFS